MQICLKAAFSVIGYSDTFFPSTCQESTPVRHLQRFYTLACTCTLCRNRALSSAWSGRCADEAAPVHWESFSHLLLLCRRRCRGRYFSWLPPDRRPLAPDGSRTPASPASGKLEKPPPPEEEQKNWPTPHLPKRNASAGAPHRADLLRLPASAPASTKRHWHHGRAQIYVAP